MWFFLPLLICTFISFLSGQDFLSLPKDMFYTHILPEFVIPKEQYDHDPLAYIAHLIGYIEQKEYPYISTHSTFNNKRLIAKSQSANKSLSGLKCVSKECNNLVTTYQARLKEYITIMIPKSCTLQQVLSAYPFIQNRESYLIYLPDQAYLPWSKVFPGLRDVFSRTSLVFANYDIKVETRISNCEGWERHKKFIDDLLSRGKNMGAKCARIIRFLENSIEFIKKNAYSFKEQEEIVNSLRVFFYMLNCYNKAIKEITGNIINVGTTGFHVCLELKKLNNKDNQNESMPDDTPVMSPADIYKLYKAMLGLF